MFKHFALLVVFGLACSSHSRNAAAQETGYMDTSMGSIPDGTAPGMGLGMAQNSPFLSPGTILAPNPYQGLPQSPSSRASGRHGGAPLIVLPMNGMAGPNGPPGAQFPGSYVPPGTPLHRFNGYTVCDPPDLAAGTAPKRVVKITTTRSLAAPSHSQPCPVYTVNGEIQNQRSYNTTTVRPPVGSVLQP